MLTTMPNWCYVFCFVQMEWYTSWTAQYGGCQATEIRADYLAT